MEGMEWFRKENLKPVRMYSYPSTVTDRTYEKSWEKSREEDPAIATVFDDLMERLHKNNHMNNKVSVLCEVENGPVDQIWLCFHDGRFIIGKDAHHYDDMPTKPISI